MRARVGSVVLALFVAAISASAQGPSGLPPQASPVAQAVLEGELEVQIEDSETGSRTHHFILTSTGRFRLALADDGPGWLSGTRVRAHGRFLDAGTLELGSSNDLEAMAPASPNTFGAQHTIVILVNFQDNPSTPYDWTHAQNVTFTTTSDFFLENSHGQTWLAGDVAGWFTMPLSASNCDYNQISSAADQAATAAGVKLSNYTRKVYAFPQTSACGWWGLGTVGGNPSRAWINGTYSLKVVAHELGHNFGDYHSRSKACTTSGCTVSEYGDDADVMGNPTSGHLNAFQKERLGWLNYGDTPAILSVGQNGSYWIDSYAVNGASSAEPKALKILKEVDGSGRRTWYYVEARTRTGFDSSINPGVILHTGSEVSGREVYQVDIDPVGSTFDRRLDAGQSFEDAALGVRITTLWADATGAMIDVQFASAPCEAAAPNLSVSPAGTVGTTAGVAVSYSVGVTNRDSSACASSTFSIENLVPGGWTAASSPASLTLGPGASGGATVTITPPTSASGASDVQIGAYRSGGSGASVVRTIDVTPVSGPSAPAEVAIGLTVTSWRNGFSFAASVTADGEPVSGVAVTFVVTDPSGSTRTFSATTGSTGIASTSFKPRGKDPEGTYTVVASAAVGGQMVTTSAAFVGK